MPSVANLQLKIQKIHTGSNANYEKPLLSTLSYDHPCQHKEEPYNLIEGGFVVGGKSSWPRELYVAQLTIVL